MEDQGESGVPVAEMPERHRLRLLRKRERPLIRPAVYKPVDLVHQSFDLLGGTRRRRVRREGQSLWGRLVRVVEMVHVEIQVAVMLAPCAGQPVPVNDKARLEMPLRVRATPPPGTEPLVAERVSVRTYQPIQIGPLAVAVVAQHGILATVSERPFRS